MCRFKQKVIMNIILVDSNLKTLATLKKHVNEILPLANVAYFVSGKEVLDYATCNKIDVLMCDVHMKDMLGTTLFKKLKNKRPKLNVIFNTSDESFKPEALDLKVSGYIIKPATKNKLQKELNELRYPIEEVRNVLRVQCFGNFSVYNQSGEIFKFSRTKEKELFAYLIYKCGSEVNLKELGAILFEDKVYDNKQQAYLQQLLFCLAKDLKRVNLEKLLVRKYNSIAINTDYVDCDYYRFNNNEPAAKRMYTGEFMMQYEWADHVAAYLDSKELY